MYRTLHLLVFSIISVWLFYTTDSWINHDQCAAWTGYYGPGGTLNIAELIVCTRNLYDKIGKERAEILRNKLCSVNNQLDAMEGNYAYELLNMTGYLENGTTNKLCNMKSIDPVTIENLPPIIPHFNRSHDYDFDPMMLYINKYKQVYTNFMNRNIPDYKVFKNNLSKYQLVKMMAREYCLPLVNTNDPVTNRKLIYHFLMDKYDDTRYDEEQNESSFIQCLGRLVNTSSIEFICEMAHDKGWGRVEYCEQWGKANPNYPLPLPKATDKLYEALKICLETESVLGDSISYRNFDYDHMDSLYQYQMDIFAMFNAKPISPWKDWADIDDHHSKSSRKFYDHDIMCMSDDSKKISKYFECYNHPDGYEFHDEYMRCIGLRNISMIDKQSLACNRGLVYLGRDIRMRSDIWKCLESISNYSKYSGCSKSTEFVKNRELRTRIDSNFESTHACFNKSFHSNRKYFDGILEKEMKLAVKVCEYRFKDSTKYNISIMSYAKSAGKCFIGGPTETSQKVRSCYNKLSTILVTKYDSDFLLCIAPDEFINRV